MEANQANLTDAARATMLAAAPWPPAWLAAAAVPAIPACEPADSPPASPDVLRATSEAMTADELPAIEKAADAICRCGSTRWRDVPIHAGQSSRRDCARCRRFLAFVVWYGRLLEFKPAADQKATKCLI